MALRTLLWLSATLCVFALSGCSFMSTVIKNQYDLASNTDKACTAVDDTFVKPTSEDELKKQLVARLRLRLTGAICVKNCADSDNEFSRQTFPDVIRGARDRIVGMRGDLKSDFAKIDAALKSIDDSLGEIEKAIQTVDTAWKPIHAKKCESKKQCAMALLEATAKLSAALDPGLEGSPYLDIERKLALVERESAVIIAKLQNDYVDLGEQLKLTVLDAQQVLRHAKEAVALFVSRDAPGIVETFFVTNIKYAAAEKALRWFDSGLKTVDKLIDKADERFFLLPTLVITTSESSIQKAFDEFYDMTLAKELERFDIELAFAKAACTRLSDGQSQSAQLMPFVNRMFATSFFRNKSLESANSAVQDNVVDPAKLANFVLDQGKETKIAEVKVFPTSAGGPAGSRQPPLTGLGAYERCYLAEISAATEVRRESRWSERGDARTLAAWACGNSLSGPDAGAVATRLKSQVSRPDASVQATTLPMASNGDGLRQTMRYYVRQAR